MLGLRVIDRDDRVEQLTGGRHAAQADDAGRGLLGAADDVLDEIGALGVDRGDQVRAIVHRDRRLHVESGVQVRVVGVAVLAADREDRDPEVLYQRRGGVILRAQGVAGGQRHLRPARLKRAHQVRGLGGHVQARRQPLALQRLLGRETLPDLPEHRHLLLRPLNPQLPLRGQ